MRGGVAGMRGGGGMMMMRGGGGMIPGGRGGGLPPSFSSFTGPMMMQRAPSQFVVRVRGLPFSANEGTVAEFFTDVRIPPHGVHMVYNAQERPTGEAFVEVMSEEDVALALRHSGAALGHRYIEVFRSSGNDMSRLGGAPAAAAAAAPGVFDPYQMGFLPQFMPQGTGAMNPYLPPPSGFNQYLGGGEEWGGAFQQGIGEADPMAGMTAEALAALSDPTMGGGMPPGMMDEQQQQQMEGGM